MSIENRKSDRRTMAQDARYLSILERRVNGSRRRVEKAKAELAFGQIQLALCMVGFAASWILFVSEVLPK